jgi:dTDP-4-amino-4,6-dideoxygalactose transaminase
MPHSDFIPIFNMSAKLEKYQSQAIASIEKVFEKGNLVFGDSNKNFEQNFHSDIGCNFFCVLRKP